MRHFLIALACVPLVALPAGATCRVVPRQVVVQRNVVVQKVAVVRQVVKVIPVATFVPFAVAVPTYSATYGHPGAYAMPAPAPAAAPSPDMAAIARALDGINARLDRLERPDAPPPPPPTPPRDPFAPPPMPKAESRAPAGEDGKAVLGIFARSCASCHGEATAQAKGAGLVLVRGGALAPLTDRQSRQVLTSVYTQRMPKSGPKLTDAEVGALVEWFDRR